MNLSEAEKWLDHLTSCSPCYRDFSQFRIAHRNRRTRTLVAIAAVVVMVAEKAADMILGRAPLPRAVLAGSAAESTA